MDKDKEWSLWVEFIKELKNTQLNKWNASSVKIWALVTFLASGIIFLINNIDNTISLNPIMVILSFMFGLSNLGFTILNTFFRKELVEENIFHKHNELKRQIVAPVIFSTNIVLISWLISNIFTILYLSHDKEYNINIAPQIFYLINIGWLLTNALTINRMIQKDKIKIQPKRPITIKFKNEIVSMKYPNNKRITGIITIIILLALICLQFYQFYKSGFFIKNKRNIIYSLYIFGFLGSSVWIGKYYSYKIIYTWVEDFYNDIFRQNLSAQEIKNKYTNEFASNNSLENFVFRKKESN